MLDKLEGIEMETELQIW